MNMVAKLLHVDPGALKMALTTRLMPGTGDIK